MSKIKYPVIAVTQDLRQGHVLVLTEDGIARDPRRAELAFTPDAAEALMARARRLESQNLIVATDLVEVEARADGPWPRAYRERFRLFGPTLSVVQPPRFALAEAAE
jgi:hypothetical protein